MLNTYSLKESTPLKKTFDAIVIGSGPGAGLCALELVRAGLEVAIIEMGPHKKKFKMNEAESYGELYQDGAGRTTDDGSIKILQGKALGGGSLVNWTSSFRTPTSTLEYWQSELGLKNTSERSLEPHFEAAEDLINVRDWELPINRNNEVLEQGLKNRGYSVGKIKRNVRGCRNLGYCGMGCPVGAKQTSVETSISEAVRLGAYCLVDAIAWKFNYNNKRIDSLEVLSGEKKTTFSAKYFFSGAGAIGTPALMLRSQLPNPFLTIGQRTFLHPVVASGSFFDDEVAGYYGAPQTIYSDHFNKLDLKHPGFKLEVPPIHPLLIATAIPWHGSYHSSVMKRLSEMQAMIALQRDGFHPQSIGGVVGLDKFNNPTLNYPITEYMKTGFKKALEIMMEVQLAAGAREVAPLHRLAKPVSTMSQVKALMKELPMEKHHLRLLSAHVMGGARMGTGPEHGVVDENGKFFHLKNLWVVDGSLFPTSLGANPMVSILGLVGRNMANIITKL